jgi:hypothetical protein
MSDQSHLDAQYFIDEHVYNCPFCNRRNVQYYIIEYGTFHWSSGKECFFYVTVCTSCTGRALHLSHQNLRPELAHTARAVQFFRFTDGVDLDSKLFYSHPTSFFALDEAIPRVLRELITEADGCLKMNFLTGASACMRKAIYELLVLEKASGVNYDEKIKDFKRTHPGITPDYIDILGAIKDMTSDKVHEQSWEKWDSNNLKLLIETLKAILYEIYVVPAQRKKRTGDIQKLRSTLGADKRAGGPAADTPPATQAEGPPDPGDTPS